MTALSLTRAERLGDADEHRSVAWVYRGRRAGLDPDASERSLLGLGSAQFRRLEASAHASARLSRMGRRE